MIKVLKYDYKQLLLVPLFLTIILFIINTVLLILVPSVKASRDFFQVCFQISNFSNYFVVVGSSLYMGVILLIKELKKYKLYEMTDLNPSIILLTRYLVYFLTILFIAFVGMVQATFINAFAVASNAAIVNTINLNFFVFSMLHKPALSWLLCVSMAFIPILIYSVILIISALNRLIKNNIAKTLVIISVAIVLSLILLEISSISDNAIFPINLNYNLHHFMSVYLPLFTPYNNNINPNSLFVCNILNIYYLFFSTIFVCMSILIFNLSQNKNRITAPLNTKPTKKRNTIKIINIVTASLMAFLLLSFSIKYTLIMMVDELNTSEQNHDYSLHLPNKLIVMNVGDKISLDENLNLNENTNSLSNKVIKADKCFELYPPEINDLPSAYSMGFVFIDNNNNLYAQKAGLHKYKVRIGVNMKNFTYNMHNFFDLTILVNDIDYSDYKKVYSLDDIDSQKGKYILMDNLIYNNNKNKDFVFEEFNGILINPYNYIIELNNISFINRLNKSGILDNLIVKTTIHNQINPIEPFTSATGFVNTNYGSIINCNVNIDLTANIVSGFCMKNAGIVYRNSVSGIIEAQMANGLTNCSIFGEDGNLHLIDNISHIVFKNVIDNDKYDSIGFNDHEFSGTKIQNNGRNIINNNGHAIFIP